MKIFDLKKQKASWAVIVGFFFLVASMTVSPSISAGDSVTAENDIVLVHPGRTLIQQVKRTETSPNGTTVTYIVPLSIGERMTRQLVTQRIDVVETYESFVLARTTEIDRKVLSNQGFEVVEMPDRTVTGRGIYHFDTRLGEPSIPEDLRVKTVGPEQESYFILQFVGPVKSSWMGQVAAFGVEMHDYLPSYAYVIEARNGITHKLRDLEFVEWIGEYHPAYKMSPLLEEASSLVDVSVTTFEGGEYNSVIDHIFDSGGMVYSHAMTSRGGVINARIDSRILGDLARIEQVSWIEPYGILELANNQVRWIVQSGATDYTPIHDWDIAGQGQTVTVCDTGLHGTGTSPGDFLHEAFEDPHHDFIYGQVNPDHRKVYLYYFVEENGVPFGNYIDEVGHGTHVSGTVSGDAPLTDHGDDFLTYNKYDGMEFKGKLVICDLFLLISNHPADYDNIYRPGYEEGSRIFTNSWGFRHMWDGELVGDYTTRSRMVDEFMWSHKDALIIFANGNEGPGPMSMRQEAAAKDIVSVGATQNVYPPNPTLDPNNMATFSSRGPTLDGRLKPTVVSPGEYVISASRSWDGYHGSPGTSMAAPSVAGSAAQIRQYFTEGWYPTGTKEPGNGFDPSAALMKAMLINGGWEISGTGSHDHPYNGMAYPNNDQGWGRIRLWDSMYFAPTSTGSGKMAKLFVADETWGLKTGQSVDYYVHVADESSVKITLGWTDFPGTPGATKAQVNNLDLLVTDPEGHQYKGNVFCTPSCSPSQSVEGGIQDEVNVEERVVRYNTPIGTWKITVTATNVDPLHGRQPFALVVTGQLAEETRQSHVQDQSEPSIVVDADGNAHMVWIQQDTFLEDVDVFYSKVARDGQVLIEDKSLTESDDGDGDQEYSPVIAIDGAGTLYVFFADEHCDPGPGCTSPVTRTYFIDGKRSDDGGLNWVDLNLAIDRGYVFLHTGGLDVVDKSKPIDVVIDDGGILHLLWHTLVTGDPFETEYLRYSQSISGGVAWIPTQDLVTYPDTNPMQDHYNRIRYPHIAVGSRSPDYMHAVYSFDDDPIPFTRPSTRIPTDETYIFYLFSMDNGLNWIVTSTPLITTTQLAWENSLIADYTGGVYLAWNDMSGESSPDFDVDVLFQRSTDNGQNWDPEMTLAEGSWNQHYPTLALDSSGFLHLLWYNVQFEWGMGNVCDVYHRASVDKGQYWHGKRLLTMTYGNQTEWLNEIWPCGTISAVADQEGVLHVAWDRGGLQLQDGIYYATPPYEFQISYASQSSALPRIASSGAGSAGNIHMVWLDRREGADDYMDLTRDGNADLYSMKHNGEVYLSPNQGISWLYRGDAGTETYISIDSNILGNIYALAEFGRVYRSTDGGLSWTYLSDIGNRIDFMEIDARAGFNTVYALDSTGQVYVSTDAVSWSLLGTDAPGDDFVSLDADTTILYALRIDGEVWRSSDGGVSWFLDRNAGTETYSSIESDGLGMLYALARTGELYVRDLSSVWAYAGKASGDDDHWSVAIDVNDNLYVQSKSGPAYLSEDGGVQWSSMGDVGNNNEVFYSKVDGYGRRRQTETRISDIADNMDGIDQFDPVIVVGLDPVTSNEAVYVFYADQRVDLASPSVVEYVVKGKKSTDEGDTWNPLSNLPDGILFSSDQGPIYDRYDLIDAAIDSVSGEVHLLYSGHTITATTETEYIEYTMSSDGGISWSTPEQIFTPASYGTIGESHYDKIGFPRITVGSPGYVHAVFSWDPGMGPLPGPPWCYPGQSDCNTYVRHLKSYIGVWEQQNDIRDIGSTRDVARPTSLVADATSGVFVTWHDWTQSGTFDILYARSLSDGANWFSQQVVVDGSDHQTYPAFELDSQGYLYLVYSDDAVGQYDIFYRVTIDPHASTPSWTNIARFTSGEGQSVRVDTVIDEEGRLHICWQDNKGFSVTNWYEIYHMSWL